MSAQIILFPDAHQRELRALIRLADRLLHEPVDTLLDGFLARLEVWHQANRQA